jgi:hypothetical protein
MGILEIIGVLAVGFTVLGVFAAGLGADSREWGRDDWRPIA